MTRKTYEPKPLNPGAPIAWAHIQPNGTEQQRTGIVWSLGPLVRGNCAALWVSPDVCDDDDAYPAAVLVLIPHRTAKVYAGSAGPYWPGEWSPAGGRLIRPGEPYSETHPDSRTGAEVFGLARMYARRHAA